MELYTIQNAWAKSLNELAKELKADTKNGLSKTEALERLREQGINSFGETNRYSILITFARQFASPLILILLAAAGVTLFFHDYLDALFIAMAVTVAVSLGFYQEYKAERATAALRSYIEEKVRLWRNGKEMVAEAKTVVTGDVILLRAGERVAADGRLLNSHDLAIDESVLTGESLPVTKGDNELAENTPLSERSNMVFGGTYVAEGQGMMLVTATGLQTEFGQIAAAVLSTSSERTPLQKAVSTMGFMIALVAFFLIIGVYFLGLARGMEHLDIFLIAIAIAVSIIPEALPPGLTAILAVGVERIAKQKGIVRSLLAAETLGSATIIITDKTGTLTTGSLELVEVLHADSALTDEETSVEAKRKILALAVSNTNAIINNPEKPAKSWKISGRHLDIGILKAAITYDVPVATILKDARPVKLFASAHKYSIYRSGEKEVVLGAPDILLRHADISTNDREKLENILHHESGVGRRLLGVGYKVGGDKENMILKFVGFLIFYDPLRPKMKEAINDIESSGCRVVMATGDLSGTAIAIAKSLGWETNEKHVLTGEDMSAMSDEELIDALQRVRVFARMTPEDKYRVIELLEGAGEVVAMLGDGVNDAPSLQRASIGVAVGSGTDVAKGVADLVLLDDNFQTIKAAIDEGRLILANIRKTFVYLMSNSFDGVVLLGGSMALGLALPLTPLQIIWVNFFTGSIPAIAYAFDREMAGQRGREHAILSREVLILTFGIGLISSVSLLLLYYLISSWGEGGIMGRTFLFACFSSYILFIAYSFRNLHKPILKYNPFENKALNIGVAFGVGLLLLTLYLPFFQNIFGTTTLSPVWLSLVGLWIVGNMFLVEIAKYLMIQKKF